MAVLKPFEDSTGIKVQYESTRDEDAILRTRVAAGNAPDLAAAPSPQLLTQFAKDGKVKPLNNAVDMNALSASTSQGWIKLGEPLSDGKLYQIFSWAAVKGLVWYDPKNFSSKNYTVPKTWQDLVTLQGTIKSSGTPPWCIAVASGGAADGWPASDWLKEIVLSQAGPDVYDKWVAGTQTWTSPEIKSAFQTFGTILGPNDSNVYGGKNTILATQFGDVGTPMFANPPKCYMLNQASFITTFFTSAVPSLQAGTDFTFFPLPDINTSCSSRFPTSTPRSRARTWSRATRGRCSTTRPRPGSSSSTSPPHRPRTSGLSVAASLPSTSRSALTTTPTPCRS